MKHLNSKDFQFYAIILVFALAVGLITGNMNKNSQGTAAAPAAANASIFAAMIEDICITRGNSASTKTCLRMATPLFSNIWPISSFVGRNKSTEFTQSRPKTNLAHKEADAASTHSANCEVTVKLDTGCICVYYTIF